MSIKIKYMCLAPRKHPDQAQLSVTAGRELTPSEADGNQEGFGFTLSPFSIKQAWILTQPRWFLGTWVHHFTLIYQLSKQSCYCLPQQLISWFISLSCRKRCGWVTQWPYLCLRPSGEHQLTGWCCCMDHSLPEISSLQTRQSLCQL